MRKGQQIKYCSHISWGKEVIKTAFVLSDDGGDYIRISDTKEDLNNGIGYTISVDSLRKTKYRRLAK